MATEGRSGSTSAIDDVMDDVRRGLVRRMAATDRDENREIYDALEDE